MQKCWSFDSLMFFSFLTMKINNEYSLLNNKVNKKVKNNFSFLFFRVLQKHTIAKVEDYRSFIQPCQEETQKIIITNSHYWIVYGSQKKKSTTPWTFLRGQINVLWTAM